MSEPLTVSEGDVFHSPHPFCYDLASKPGDDPEGAPTIYFMSWRPGVRFELLAPDGGDNECVADGMGFQLLTVVSVHKPGRFPTRVFYTRKWRDPRGREFGKDGLRVKTLDAFKRIARGYRHEYRLTNGEELAEHIAEQQKDQP